MNLVTEFNQAFQRARELHAQGRLGEAERALQELATPGEHRETVLRALFDLYAQTGRLQDAIDTMAALTEELPDQLYYFTRLAALLEGRGQLDAAISHYLRLLERQPRLADAHYNLALLYKKGKRYSEAMASYEAAVRLGISRAEEVYSNMGVLCSELHQKDKAKEMYDRALQANSAYVPALFNLAGLLEEAGDRHRALELYESILLLQPGHWESLARLAYARRITSNDDSLVASLRRAIEDPNGAPLAREGLYFALGKALDDLGRYEDAFAAYCRANDLGRLRNPPYDRRMVEQAFGRLIELYSPEWLGRAATASTAQPIFICGMFRSGSTLVEQILASHPAMTAGGELDFLPLLVERELMPYPEGATGATTAVLEKLGDEYLSGVRSLFPGASLVSDKRPDNFLHLGLIKAMFPAARIIYTRRDPRDNCLSVYFSQLGGNLNYATDLEGTAHYYRQHVRLMKHWQKCFGGNIFTVDYGELVRSPEPILRRLLAFLGLQWDDRCLTFHRSDNLVKTASVWQVREELYSHSSGRWQNYAGFLQDILPVLEGDGV